jgi:hypothetical protein
MIVLLHIPVALLVAGLSSSLPTVWSEIQSLYQPQSIRSVAIA